MHLTICLRKLLLNKRAYLHNDGEPVEGCCSSKYSMQGRHICFHLLSQDILDQSVRQCSS